MKLNQRKIIYKNPQNATFCDVLKSVVVTELSTKVLEGLNVYTFEVAKWAHKPIIKKSIEYLFSVNVKKVNIKNQPGKGKFKNNKYKVTSSKKIAMITLEKNQVIDVNKL
ncbi:50S ribosomal protein L23 [Rickettsiales bacterium (ex Bugula neritina AB1)]|nr:50S ribosomal protein L23 [Rickettsiales bacterium (ex Bugula neritina AB1)]